MSSGLKGLLGAFCSLAFGAGLGVLSEPADRVAFLSVGQGDCTVIQTDGRTVLIDAGPTVPHFDAGERIVTPRLRALGVDRVDLILLSHPDLDHIGGTGAVLRTFPGAQIAVSSEFRNDEHMLKRLGEWHVSPADVAWLGPHEIGRIGRFQVRIECPPVNLREDNVGSMFVRIDEDQASAVFSGDAPMDVEQTEAGKGDWSAELLHVGHHGSSTATSESWLRAVHPQCAIISCGRNNRYGHPNLSTLNRLAAFGVPTDRTDREGDIVFEVQHGRFVRVKPP